MFRIMQTSVALAISLIVVSGSQAGKPGTTNGTQPKAAPTNTPAGGLISRTNGTTPITLQGTATNAFGGGLIGKVNGTTPITFKDPVHGTGSPHNPRSPVNTHGHDYGKWSHRYWNSSYGCEYYWSLADDCYFYFYAPANCYYPITVIEQFPPVRTAAAR